jgi:hypothetical protein
VPEQDVAGVLKGEVRAEARILCIPGVEAIRSGWEGIHISIYLVVDLEEDVALGELKSMTMS